MPCADSPDGDGRARTQQHTEALDVTFLLSAHEPAGLVKDRQGAPLHFARVDLRHVRH
jgi:hypothetical protein